VLTIAYLANQFPSPVEPYVVDEIEELKRRDVQVVAGSVWTPAGESATVPEIVLQPFKLSLLLQALWLCFQKWKSIWSLVARVLFGGREGFFQRGKALLQIWLGAYYAIRLSGRGVQHVHAHHGYFGSWIAMVAARLLGITFSMTLHGSDLLQRKSYLDVKLANCLLCLTVSEYNRRYILEHYPAVDPGKLVVSRLGVDVLESPPISEDQRPVDSDSLTLLAVGRLHAVKDHAFLVQACAQLREFGVRFKCSIAGEGPERRRLESLIGRPDLEHQVTLLGHVAREQLDSLYDHADLVVLTSRSEGIPLVLMEAMARGKIVLAPAITGIPELVLPGQTGFLYEPGSLDSFVERLIFIHALLRVERLPDHGSSEVIPYLKSAAQQLNWIRHAARSHVRHNFNGKKNLKSFGDLFLAHITHNESTLHENFVLQQIQLPIQRDRSLPVRTYGVDEGTGARSGPVLNG